MKVESKTCLYMFVHIDWLYIGGLLYNSEMQNLITSLYKRKGSVIRENFRIVDESKQVLFIERVRIKRLCIAITY